MEEVARFTVEAYREVIALALGAALNLLGGA